MSIVAALRSVNGALIGKACVPEWTRIVTWGPWSFDRTPWGGADEDGEFILFTQTTEPKTRRIDGEIMFDELATYFIVSLAPMKRIKYLAV